MLCSEAPAPVDAAGAPERSKPLSSPPRAPPKDVYAGRNSYYEVTQLRPGRTYLFRLRAQWCPTSKRVRRDAWCDWHESLFTTDGEVPLAPRAPLMHKGGESVRSLSLTCVGIDGCGAPITCVRLELQAGAVGMEETFYQSFPGTPSEISNTLIPRVQPADQESMSSHLAAGASCCHIILHTPPPPPSLQACRSA